MGGSNSGRYRERNRGTVEGALRLDIRALRRMGFLRPGAVTSGPLTWRWTATGEESGSVNLTVNLTDPDYGQAVVRFRLNGEPRQQEIAIVCRPMRFGGRRYYFVCPRRHHWCEVLPMSGGVFASRQAHRLTYQSQSQDRLGRLRDRAGKLEKRVWPDNPRSRPRGRNRARLVAAWAAADEAFEGLFHTEMIRRFGYLL